MNSFTPVLSVWAHMAEVLTCHMGLRGRAARRRAEELMEMAGLPAELLSRYPHELSGGQKQRSALAIALACDPDFLLADEPTTALDVVTQRGILATLKSLVEKRGLGVFFVTHDLALAADLCDRIAVMYRGKIVEEGPPGDLISAPRHPHTQAIIRSLMDVEGGKGGERMLQNERRAEQRRDDA
jgi:ABC-type glutathione transport system ATPase component